MPVGFGPSLGPRQGPDGRRFNGEEYRSTHMSVTLAVDPERLAPLLPPGYEPSPNPTVRVQTNFLKDVPWLAGRGYNFAEVLFSVVFHCKAGEIEGDLVSVMWESMADPIISGREELGLPKLFADIPDLQPTADGMRMSASWCGFEFLSVDLLGLQLGPWPAEREATTESVKRSTGGSNAGRARLYYKYFPKTGRLDQPEVCYTTVTPPGNYEMKVLETWTGDARVNFCEARWEDLPTMAQIANGLAGLGLGRPIEARLSRQRTRFNDLTDDQLVLE